jgi:hypothetical protein
MSEDRQLGKAVYSRDPVVTPVLAGLSTAKSVPAEHRAWLSGEVRLAIRLFRWRAFEQATDGWAMDFLMRTTKLLLDHGCRQVIEDRTEEESWLEVALTARSKQAASFRIGLPNEGKAYGPNLRISLHQGNV